MVQSLLCSIKHDLPARRAAAGITREEVAPSNAGQYQVSERQMMVQNQLSHHILPSASTMLGVCLTGIGLVKVAEAHLGSTRIDEYLALNAVCFLISCMCSYSSIRRNNRSAHTRDRLEQIADYFFMLGLVAMTFISILFAYEIV